MTKPHTEPDGANRHQRTDGVPTDRQMEALTLRVRHRLTFAEIGHRLGITKDAAEGLCDRAMVAMNVPVSRVIREQRRALVRWDLEAASTRLFQAGMESLDADTFREWRGVVARLCALDGLDEPTRSEVKLDMTKWASLPPEEVRFHVTNFVRDHLAVLGPIVDQVRRDLGVDTPS